MDEVRKVGFFAFPVQKQACPPKKPEKTGGQCPEDYDDSMTENEAKQGMTPKKYNRYTLLYI